MGNYNKSFIIYKLKMNPFEKMNPRDPHGISRRIEKIQRQSAQKHETSVRNISSVPPKATIRLEYIRYEKGIARSVFRLPNMITADLSSIMGPTSAHTGEMKIIKENSRKSISENGTQS